MYTLTPELQRYLKIVDPYMTLDELAVAFKVCMTVMIRLRKDMNLDPKPKGRPKNREAIIINGIIYPEHVQEAITKIITLRTREEKALIFLLFANLTVLDLKKKQNNQQNILIQKKKDLDLDI